jgi:hypothetical protein
MPGLRFDTQAHTVRPLHDIGGKRDQVEIPVQIRRFKQPSTVSYNGHTQGRVVGPVRLHKLQQPAAHPFGILGKGNVHFARILLHALPMPREGKKGAIRDSNRAEHTPAVQQANLTRRDAMSAGVDDLIVMQHEAMHNAIVSETCERRSPQDYREKWGSLSQNR